MRGKWDYQLHKHCRSLTTALSKYSTPMHIGGRPAALVEWKPARPGPPDERFPSIFRPTSCGFQKVMGNCRSPWLFQWMIYWSSMAWMIWGGKPPWLWKPHETSASPSLWKILSCQVWPHLYHNLRFGEGPQGPQSIRVKEDVFGFPPNMVSSRIFVIHSST